MSFASFRHPSAVPDCSAAASMAEHRHAWVLVDPIAHIDDDDDIVRNATTASAITGSGSTVEVSFVLADPPGLSSCFVRCSGAKAVHRLSYCRVVRAQDSLLLLHMFFTNRADYFVYRAGPGKPSLYLLPHPYPAALNSISKAVADQVAILPCGNKGNQFFLVLPVMKFTHRDVSYDLHVFSSETQGWITKQAKVDWGDEETQYNNLVSHRASKVVVVDGGGDSCSLLGWIDLWQGILICNFLDVNPVMRLIQLPPPCPGNMADDSGLGYEMMNACSCRDVTFSNGCFRFVEIDFHDSDDYSSSGIYYPDEVNGTFNSKDEINCHNTDVTIDSNKALQIADYGWTATIWKRMISSDDWNVCLEVDSSEISISDSCFPHVLPEMRDDDEVNKMDFNKVLTAAPMLGLLDDDLLYMMAKLNINDSKAWVLAVNPETHKLEALAQFSAERVFYFEPTYLPCSFSKYIGIDTADPLEKCIQRKKECVEACLLAALDQLKDIDKIISLLCSGPASSVHANIRAMTKYGSSNGHVIPVSDALDAASECLRVLGDLELRILAPLGAMKSQIRGVLGTLLKPKGIRPPELKDEGEMVGLDVVAEYIS